MRRAVEEVERWAPGAKCLTEGSGEELAADCDVLVTEWSALAFVGLALGKETHSYRDLDEMRNCNTGTVDVIWQVPSTLPDGARYICEVHYFGNGSVVR